MRKFVLLMMAVLATGSLLAQNRQVSGNVTSSDGPVIGVVVSVEGASTSAVTDVTGRYSISAPTNGTLSFQSFGFQTANVAIEGRAVVNVELVPDAQRIQDVVVTGYGTMSRAQFTGSAATIGTEEITRKSDASFLKSLEGNVPGVSMQTSTSLPGAQGTVLIRGRGSFSSGTAPLYVIDGMQVNSDAAMLYSGTGDYFDPMASINPGDIESITVLKDAAATAIYGSRASNGVIVITTKKGRAGMANLTLDIRQGFVTMGNHNMDFADANLLADTFAGGYVAAGQQPDFNTARDYVERLYASNFGWDGQSSYDWIDAVTRKGYYQDYNLSFSGREGSTGYFISMGYLNTEGLVIGSDMKRYTGRVNINSKYKMFTFGATMSYSLADKNSFTQSTSGSFLSAITAATTQMLPMFPFYDEDGKYANIDYYNPLALYDEDLGEIDNTKNTMINLAPYLQVDFGYGIYAKSTLGANLVNDEQYKYNSGVYNPQYIPTSGFGTKQLQRTSDLTWSNVAGWIHTFDSKHHINLMLGQEMVQRRLEYDVTRKENYAFAEAGLRDFATAGTMVLVDHGKEEANLASYFAKADYSFDDKYYFSASFRRDGSSVFGLDNRWGNFWSVGAKWRMISENFMADNGVLTDAVIRASYGTVGNQDIPWYRARGSYAAGYNYNSSPGMVPTTIPNRSLTWEVSKTLDLGFDVSFIDRINLTFDYYNRLTTDALYNVPVSMTSGMTSSYLNIGEIRNVGVELGISGDIIRNENLIWSAYANMTFNKNEIEKLATEKPVEGNYWIMEEGRPYNQLYLREYAGVDRETGEPMWYKGSEGEETTKRYTEAGQRYVGNADPKFYGGFGTSLNWKGLDFNVAFNYRVGGKVVDTGVQFTGFGMANNRPVLKDVALNSWTPENKDAKYPQWIMGDPNQATSHRFSTRFLYSSDYLRISNITLGYTLPERWTEKALIKKLRVYVSADNLYTFTAKDFVGYTPDTYTDGLIAWQYPSTRTFIGGIQLTF